MAQARLRARTALAIFAVLSVALFVRTWTAPSTSFIGGPNDPELESWFLRWMPWAISHGHNPLLTDHLDYPAGANLMWNVLLPLPGLLLWPVTALFGAVVSYNLLVTAGVALTGWCAFLMLRRWVRSDVACLAGGLFFGFSPYVLAAAQLHPHVAIAASAPLFVLLLDDVLVRRPRAAWRTGALLGLLASAQFLLGQELLADEVVAAAVLVAVLAALWPQRAREAVPQVLQAGAVALVVFAVICAYPLGVQLFGAQRPPSPLQPADVYEMDLLNPVVPTPFLAVSPAAALNVSRRFSGNAAEWGGYLGVPLLLLCAWTVARCRGTTAVRVAALVAPVIAVFSLGPRLHVAGTDTGVPLPWRAVSSLPVLSDILPDRLAVFVALAVALLVAVFVERVLLAPSTRRLAAAALLTLAVLTVAPELPFASTAADVPGFFHNQELLDRVPEGSVALVLPWAHYRNNDAMLWQSAANMRFRMPEGYVYVPGPRGEAINVLTTATSQAVDTVVDGGDSDTVAAEHGDVIRAELKGWQVRSVLVGPMRNEQAVVRLMTAILGRSPQSTGGVLAWFDVDLSSVALRPARGVPQER